MRLLLFGFFAIIDLHLLRYSTTEWILIKREHPLLQFSAMWHCSKSSSFDFFFELFKGLQKVPFSIISIFCSRMDVKNPNGFTFICTGELLKNLTLFIILDFFLKTPKGVLSFFSYFATNWSFKSPKSSHFTNLKTLSLRYSVDFGRSRHFSASYS